MKQPISENQCCQSDAGRRRQETVSAEGMDDERLQVDQPETSDSHWNCQESDCVSRPPVTECGEHSGGQDSKVGDRSDSSEGHPRHVGIFAAEDGRTILSASNIIAADVLHGQITTVSQANNGHCGGK